MEGNGKHGWDLRSERDWRDGDEREVDKGEDWRWRKWFVINISIFFLKCALKNRYPRR